MGCDGPMTANVHGLDQRRTECFLRGCHRGCPSITPGSGPARGPRHSRAVRETLVLRTTFANTWRTMDHVTDIIGYVRVSTDEQADSQLGLEAQRSAIAAEAERRGWRVITIFEDAGVSGKDLNRPGMKLVLETLKARRADVLVVAKLDRLGRSLLDLAGLIDKAGKQGWALVALDIGVDTGSLTGKAMAGMMAVFAELERGLIGQRTRDALRAARARGTVLGRPRVLSDAVVARILAERSAGLSYRAIAKRLTDEGIPTAQGGSEWKASTLHRVVTSAEGRSR